MNNSNVIIDKSAYSCEYGDEKILNRQQWPVQNEKQKQLFLSILILYVHSSKWLSLYEIERKV